MAVKNRMNIPLVGAGKTLIGSGSSNFPSANTLTAGTGIDINNTDGGIEIVNSVVSDGYVKYLYTAATDTTISSAGNLVTVSLPANTANTDGDLIEIEAQILLTRSTGTFAGNAQIITGSSNTTFYAYSMSSSTRYIGVFARMIRKSSSTAFLDLMMTGGAGEVNAVLNTSVSIDFTSNQTVGTYITISSGTGTIRQRMLSVKVSGT